MRGFAAADDGEGVGCWGRGGSSVLKSCESGEGEGEGERGGTFVQHVGHGYARNGGVVAFGHFVESYRDAGFFAGADVEGAAAFFGQSIGRLEVAW